MRTILSNTQTGITRMLPYDVEHGLTLEDWTAQGLHEVTLPPDAVRAMLRHLPGEMLQASLAAHQEAMRVLDAHTAGPVRWPTLGTLCCCDQQHHDHRATVQCQDREDELALREALVHAMAQQQGRDDTPLELRATFAGRTGLGTLPCPGEG